MQKMKAQHSQMLDYDRSFEKNFKKEFPGLGFNQLEALMKCFKYENSKSYLADWIFNFIFLSGKDPRFPKGWKKQLVFFLREIPDVILQEDWPLEKMLKI